MRHTPVDGRVVPAIYARTLIEVAREYGVRSDAALAGTALTLADLAEPADRITLSQQLRLQENIAQVYPKPGLGLRYARRLHVQHHGAWGMAVQSSANLGQAITVCNRYLGVLGPACEQHLTISGSVARLVFKHVVAPGLARRLAIEEAIAIPYGLFRKFTGGRFVATEVWLDFPEPPGASVYAKLLGCKVQFGRASIEIRFAARLLKLPLLWSDPEAVRACEARCREILDRLVPARDTALCVRQALIELPCDSRRLESVASRLHLAPRTMRRRLRAEGAQFRDLRDEVRRELATTYLRETVLNVEEIGELVGYSDEANFRHAFLSWTGQSPAAYRASSTTKPQPHRA